MAKDADVHGFKHFLVDFESSFRSLDYLVVNLVCNLKGIIDLLKPIILVYQLFGFKRYISAHFQ